MEQIYVCIHEYEGSCSGTLSEIEEWMCNNEICLGRCDFYKLGDKVEIRLEVNYA